MSIKIVSDFSDYYDSAMDINSSIVYNRTYDRLMSKGLALDKLRKAGIKTIDVKQVSQQPFDIDKVLVYTNTKIHGSEGKRLIDRVTAEQTYKTYPSSQWYKREGGITLKVLQIGVRRFALYYRNNAEEPYEGTFETMQEIASGLNGILAEPIFSIDYIIVNGEWLAVDYNNIEVLSKYKMQRVMSASEVCTEIRNSLVAYNKY